MSIDDYISELKMFMVDPRYEKLQSIINNILKLNVDNETVVKLYNDVIYLKDHMDDYENKIEALQGQIDKLKKENGELKKEIVDLRKENGELKKEIVELKKENTELKKRIMTLEMNAIINKMLTSLQDLNALDELEINLNTSLSKCYYDLRNERNSNNHYIRLEGDKADPKHLVQYKKFVLYQVLTSLNEDIKEDFEYYYGEGLIDGTIKYLEGVINKDVQVSEKEERLVKRWWGL